MAVAQPLLGKKQLAVAFACTHVPTYSDKFMYIQSHYLYINMFPSARTRNTIGPRRNTLPVDGFNELSQPPELIAI